MWGCEMWRDILLMMLYSIFECVFFFCFVLEGGLGFCVCTGKSLSILGGGGEEERRRRRRRIRRRIK